MKMKDIRLVGKIFLFVLAIWFTNTVWAQDKAPRKEVKATGYSRVKNYDLSFLAANSGDIEDLDFLVGDAKNFMLIIAIDKYKYWKSLANPVKDARDFKKVLMDRYGFETQNIFELYNEEATLENIESAFESLKQKGSNQDNLIIYYSGHGYYDPSFDLGYWVPSEGRTNNNATSTFIPNDNIRNYIKALEFRHVFMIADACFSGSLFLEDSRGAKQEKAESIRSRYGLSSGNLEEVSDGEKGKNSPFAKTLIDYLQNNLQDRLRVDDLIEVVLNDVKSKTQKDPKGQPLSGVGHEGGVFVLTLQGTKETPKETKNKPGDN
jgi:hypothetical protein